MPCCKTAGCFAAGTGFLLNFTICEHPPGRQSNRGSSISASEAPLAPDQHRLTDDGEPLKPEPLKPAAAAQQGRRQTLKGSKAQLAGEGEDVCCGVQRDGREGSQLEDTQTAGGKGQLLQGAVTQIKVSNAKPPPPPPPCGSCCLQAGRRCRLG